MDKRALVKFPVQTAPDEWVELARRAECAECLISAQTITVKDKKYCSCISTHNSKFGMEIQKQPTEFSSTVKIISRRT